MTNRHYHIWHYERDEDGRINTMRRIPETYETRRKANYALESFRFSPGMRGPIKRPGQVIACDDGAFCEPHTGLIAGLNLVGNPLTLRVTRFIDNQTNSLRPARKEVIAQEAMERMVKLGDAEIIDDADAGRRHELRQAETDVIIKEVLARMVEAGDPKAINSEGGGNRMSDEK